MLVGPGSVQRQNLLPQCPGRLGLPGCARQTNNPTLRRIAFVPPGFTRSARLRRVAVVAALCTATCTNPRALRGFSGVALLWLRRCRAGTTAGAEPALLQHSAASELSAQAATSSNRFGLSRSQGTSCVTVRPLGSLAVRRWVP